MKKIPIVFKGDMELKAAIQKAAKKDKTRPSGYIRDALTDILTAEGFLKPRRPKTSV